MTPTEARDSLARMLCEYGQTVHLQRGTTANGDPDDYAVRARVVKADATDLVGSVQQLRRKAIVSAEDVEACGFPLPFLPKQDRLLWNGKSLVISVVDDATRRIQGELIGYELELTGA